MTAFVLDASVTLSWYFEDEVSAVSDELLDRLDAETAAVPIIWHLEVANLIALSERGGRVPASRSAEFITQLQNLPIMVDDELAARVFTYILDLARSQRLSAYDAAYLELAMRLGVPLASKDSDLCAAAERLGVAVIRA